MVFFFHDLPTGILKRKPSPPTPGLWKYEPFRGPGHFRFSRTLSSGKPAECFYVDTSRVDFTVNAVPDYGILEVAAVSTGPLPSDLARLRKIQLVACANIQHAADNLQVSPPYERPERPHLPDEPQLARLENLDYLERVVVAGSSQHQRGGFWRNLMRAAEQLELPTRHQEFQRLYKEALARVGTEEDPQLDS